MARLVFTRPYTLYLGGSVPEGTELHENYLIGTTDQDYASNYGGYTWIMGPNETPGYIIAGVNGDKPTFWRSTNKTDESFLELVNNIYLTLGSLTTFLSAGDARTWLTENGYYYTQANGAGISGIIVGVAPDSTTWNYLIMDYDLGTESILDFGINFIGWQYYRTTILQGAGYMVEFLDRRTRNDYAVFWLDSHGNILDTYTPNKPRVNQDTLDGKWLVYNDTQNGVFKYGNGTNVYTYTYDPIAESNTWIWNWDSTTLNGAFVFTKEFSSDPNTDYLYLIKEDGSMNLITSYDNTLIRPYVILYANADFITFLISDENTGEFSEIVIFDESLNVLQNIPISTPGYDNYNLQSYSTNNILIVFWSNGDVNQEYLIINYDNTTKILINDVHDRGDNYDTLSSFSNSMYWDSNPVPDDNAFLLFYKNTGHYTGPCLNVTYLDIVSLIKGQSDIITYTYQDSGSEDKTASISNERSGNAFFIYGDTGDGNCDVTVISPDGSVSTTTTVAWSEIYDIWNGAFGNYYYLILWASGATDGLIYLITEAGTVSDAREFSVDSSYGLTLEKDDNVLIYVDNLNLWAFNNENTAFQQFAVYDVIEPCQVPYFHGEQRRDGNIAVFNSITCAARIFTPNNHTDEFVLPEYGRGGYFLAMGENYLAYSFDNGSGNTSQLYNTSGILLSSVDTSNNIWDLNIYGNRAYIINNDTIDKITTYNCTMLTPTGSQTLGLQQADDFIPDDILWWWDA